MEVLTWGTIPLCKISMGSVLLNFDFFPFDDLGIAELLFPWEFPA